MNKKLYKKRAKLFRMALKKERKRCGFSQKDLAFKLGVTQSFVSKTEAGTRTLDIMELVEYCDVMGVLLTEFVYRLEGLLLTEEKFPSKRAQQYKLWNSIYEEYHHHSQL